MKRRIKIWLRYILYFSPKFIQSLVSKKYEKHELEEALSRARRTKITKDNIECVINQLSLGNCDVLLHTSMMKLGRLEGGVKWTYKCLANAVDLDSNTLLVSALPYRGRFKEYLKKNSTFDARTAPVAMGAINEYVAKLPEAFRSVHPTHSIVAVGKDAKWYTAEHHLDKTPFGVHSPYYKIIKKRGKIVLFGADMDNYTDVHVLEDLLGEEYPIAVYMKKIYRVQCIDVDGEKLVVDTKCHNPIKGIVRDLKPMVPELLRKQIMQQYPLGEGYVSIVDAYGFACFYLQKMKEGQTMYGKIKTSKSLQLIINNLLKNL